ncbi:MAG TPA: DUF4375 domain-containing protein [Chthoniobacteraceae bacterium]|nr:DUF4375 domain-containing protein [Chthoniobacteraceae bacterium]
MPRSAATADDHAPLDWLGRFCTKLVESGPYEWTELPPAARWFFAIDVYAGEVANGGHMQYLQNTRWAAEEIAACRAGLESLSPNPFLQIFNEAAGVIDSNPDLRDRFRKSDVAGWTADELANVEMRFRELDQRFFRDARGPDALFTLAKRALLARPDVQLVDSQDAEIQRLLHAHPRYREMEAAKLQRQAAEAPRIQERVHLIETSKQVCQQLKRRMTHFPTMKDTKIKVRGEWFDAIDVQTDEGPLAMIQAGNTLVVYDMSAPSAIKTLGTATLERPLNFEIVPRSK